MPLGEMAGEIVSGLSRFLGHIFVEIVLEVAIKGPGYLISRRFDRRVEPDGGLVVFVGLAFWVAFGACGYALFRWLGAT